MAGNWDLIIAAAEANRLDPRLVAAVVEVESAGNTWATRHEPRWHYFLDPPAFAKKLGMSADTERNHQATSWGLMQVMGAVARELGYKNVLPRLLIPSEGLAWGCKKLARLVERYGAPAALAAYNAGTPDSIAGQAYAKKVIAAWDKISL